MSPHRAPPLPTTAASPRVSPVNRFDASLVERVLSASGVRTDRARAHAPRLSAAMAAYGINTPLRVAHFLAQILIESGRLQFLREIWGPTAAQRRYEGRADLGNTKPGDGKRFLGRGPLQVTGRANYRRLAEHLKAKGEPEWDVEAQPELVETVHAFTSAGEWWERNCANPIADGGDDVADVQRVSRLVNRGNAESKRPANHEPERIDAFRKVAAAMRVAGVWA